MPTATANVTTTWSPTSRWTPPRTSGSLPACTRWHPRRTARAGGRRVGPGPNPPATALAEVFEPPLDAQGVPVEGFSPRGGDVDRNGVYWAAMASGHLASFDRRKCKGPLNGPTALGQPCPEGWTFYPEPVPEMQGVAESGS